MRGKPGMSTFGIRLLEILEHAVKDAGRDGTGRRRLATRLGVSEHTMAAWFKPSRVTMIPSDRFFELACREDLLPEEARDNLWSDLGREAGYIVVPEGDSPPNGVPLLVHLADIAEAVGKLAASIRKDSSSGDLKMHDLSAARAEILMDQIHTLASVTSQMRAALIELRKN